MGIDQKDEDVTAFVERTLGIDVSHLKPCVSERGNAVSCLVHESWLKEIISGNHSNKKYVHPSSEYERQLMLQPSHIGPYPPWVRICIKILKKPIVVKSSERSIGLKSRNRGNGPGYSIDLSVAELMETISKDIYQQNWNSALESYSLAMSYLPKSQQKEVDGQKIIGMLTEKIYGLSVIKLGKKESKERGMKGAFHEKTSDSLPDSLESSNKLQAGKSNVIPLVCALENNEAFFFVEPFFRHDLKDISMFSSLVVSHSTCRILYIIYQVLHGFSWFHRHGMTFGKFGLDSIRLDKGLFLYLTTPSFKDVLSLPGHQNQENIHIDECHETRRSLEYDNDDLRDKNLLSDLNSPPEHDLMTLVDMWVRNEITNYDYLMALNYFAGRRHGDPNYHPLFPWVTDFTTQNGGYRDLTKSKFRLNKGDSQLDMTYKLALLDTEEGGGASVAHHVSDVLSDITFHAYLARRTPISVLCEHLRSNWVPNEYPSTMERLYAWTPDECIPQFFSDPTIFKSIHKDLPDLELPSWTPTAEEFIKWHREVLESDEISKNLHQWIDLTFGYKLSGKAAVRAKNVCLNLVSKNQDVNNYGIVQLFTKPHPAQCKMSDLLKLTSSHSTLTRRFLDSGSLQPFSVSAYVKSNVNESSISLNSIDDTGHGSNDHNAKDTGDDSSKIAEDEKIFLPDDCNPLKLLDTYEAIHKFKRQFALKNKSNNETERTEVSIEDLTLDKLIQRDIEALGCIIVEMVIPDKVRLVSAGLSQQQKMAAIKKLCAINPKILPRHLRSGVLRMMKLQQPSSNGSIDTTSDLYQWVGNDDDIPPLNAGLLLHPRTGIFPFPLYFKGLHLFLMKFTKARLEDRYRSVESSLDEETSKKISPEGLEHCFSNKSEYSTSQIDVAADFLPSLLPDLDEEGIHLVLYHLEPLFNNYETRLYAFTRLFDCLAQCLGPKSTFKTFLKPLIELCDSRLLQNYEHLAAQSFLSQIIVRFGLEVFLTHFVSFAVDAVAFELILDKTKRSSDRISVNSNEGIPVDSVDVETGKKKQAKSLSETKSSLYLSEDDAPGSDQEEEDYINRYDDLEEQNGISKGLFAYEREEDVEEDKGVESQDDAFSGNEIGGLVVLTKEDSSDLNDEEDTLKNDDLIKADGPPKTDGHGECNTELEEQGKIYQQLVKREYAQNVDMPVEEIMEEVGNCNKTIQETNPVTLNQFEEQVLPVKPDDITNVDICATIVSDETENSTETNSEKGGEEHAFSDDTSSEDSSNDEKSGEEEEPKTNQIDFPSADVFYQDTKAQDSKTAEQNKEDLSPLFVSGIAAESIMWLAPRLGPVLTSQYLAKQLLTMLPQCYMDVLGVEEFELEDEDRKAKWLLYCLGNFCALYGEAFVLHQYLPFAEKTVKSIHSNITARGEASLAAIFALIKYCVPYISKETLIENFEFLFKTVFQPVLRILSSWNTKFPGGGDARGALCHNYVDLLTVLSLKLERELAKELMTAPLQQFFSCFELVHMKKKEIKIGRSSFIGVSSSVEDNEDSQDPPQSPVLEGTVIKPEQIEAFYKTSVYEELCQTFSAAMAHHAYVPLCGIMGSKYMEGALYNHDLIWNLCCSHDTQLSHPGPDDVSESLDTESDTQNDECDAEVEKVLQEEAKGKSEEEADSKTNGSRKMSARRIRTPSWLTGRLKEKRKSQDIESKQESTLTTASDQYLKGSWLYHWKYQLNSNPRSRGSLFELQQIKLQTFTGHSGPVRSIYVQDSEHFFLSASKDKTVKLWSLSNHGDGTAQSASSWTYYRHSRGVFSVDMVESLRQAVSCDGSVHIWDPVQGTTIATLEPNKNSYLVAMEAMPAPSQMVCVATTEATLRFIDVRQSRFVQEWKTTTRNAAGSIRDICCSPDGRWIAVGYSSGLVSVLDVRGGLLRSQRRAHTSDVVQVSSFSNNSLFTSSLDQGLSLWRDDGAKLMSLKGHTEPLNVLVVQSHYIISSSIANKVGVHELVDEQSEGAYTSYKLLPEVFRGNVTSLGYLQLNQLLLLGGDTGNITLCA